MLHMLMTAFPENGWFLYNTLDYWQVKELLDISSTGKCNPADRIQVLRNTQFNEYLDSVAYKKYDWQFVEKRYNLFQIITETEKITENEDA